jgi:hypothetical protein
MFRTENLHVDVNQRHKESYLVGDCEDSKGRVHSSRLKLDDCIGDSNGKTPLFFPPPVAVLR